MLKQNSSLIYKQKGNILVMFTIGLFALIAMAALALDGGHLLLSKTRLQNIVDASALHAAKELTDGKSQSQAREAALSLIVTNISHNDNREIMSVVDTSITSSSQAQITSNVWVEFYDTPEATTPDTDGDGEYVRVGIFNLPLSNYLAQIFSFNKRVSAIAQAGPSTRLVECYHDLVPMLICAADPNPANNTETSYFGMPINGAGLHVMKAGSGSDSIGPGNFQLIRLNDSHGGADIRDAMAGEANSTVPTCFSPPDDDGEFGDVVPTEPGNTVGPSSQGLNTRFGIYNGPVNSTDHPGDINTCQGTVLTISDGEDNTMVVNGGEENAYKYANYIADSYDGSIESQCTSPGPGTAIMTGDSDNLAGVDFTEGRRVLSVVVGDCTNQTNGSSTIPYLGTGCFFLTQSIQSGGQDSYVIGEFLTSCAALGRPSGSANGNGPFVIVLYRVPGTDDA